MTKTTELMQTNPSPKLAAYAEPLKELINARGEIDLANMDFMPRIQALQTLQAQCPANYVMLEPVLLSQLPAGASVMPIPVIPNLKDCWSGEDARKMQLKPGHVEPTADFYIQLGQMLGVQLEEVFAGVVNDTGTEQYEVKYNASYLLPNGQVLSVEGEGKASALKTSTGTLQAHLKEMVRKKAKRNAIKALLSLPTSMEDKEFMKPWVLFRPVFRAGQSQEVDQLLALQEEGKKNAVARLYGATAPKVVDVQAEKPPLKDLGEYLSKIELAESLSELKTLGQSLQEFNLTAEQRAQLRQVVDTRKAQLKAASQAQVASEEVK